MWSCVDRLARRVYERGFDTLADEDLTETVFSRLGNPDFIELIESGKYPLPQSEKRKLVSISNIRGTQKRPTMSAAGLLKSKRLLSRTSNNYMEFIILAFGSALLAYAGYTDLKTTEIADWVPYSLITGGILFYLMLSLMQGSVSPLTSCLTTGAAFLFAGLLMHRLGQWADGDGWLFGSLGFIYFVNPMSTTLNVLIFGAGYAMFYAVASAFMKPAVFRDFISDINMNKRGLFSLAAGSGILFLISLLAISHFMGLSLGINVLGFTFATTLLVSVFIILWRFISAVERSAFTKTISVDELRKGDIPAKSMRINSKTVKPDSRGLSEEDISFLKSTRKTVTLKEGVRFAPVFLFALWATVFFPDIFLQFII